YARWQDGEVDLVSLSTKGRKPEWAVEVKWSDRYCDHPGELKSLIDFCRANKLEEPPLVTSITKTLVCDVRGIQIRFLPASLYCYTVGYNVTRGRQRLEALRSPDMR